MPNKSNWTADTRPENIHTYTETSGDQTATYKLVDAHPIIGGILHKLAFFRTHAAAVWYDKIAGKSVKDKFDEIDREINNVSGTVETVDPMTATTAGFAADAKLTGKAIKDVSANLGSLSGTVSSLSTTVAKKADASTVNTALADVWKKIYPVGAIYVSVSATNPAILFGGTWQQITGRFLLAAGGGYTAGAMGGEASHTLTVAEMPSHTHTINNGTYVIHWDPNWAQTNVAAGKTGSFSDLSLNAAGGGAAHNNMPPYLVVYMWRRTS